MLFLFLRSIGRDGWISIESIVTCNHVTMRARCKLVGWHGRIEEGKKKIETFRQRETQGQERRERRREEGQGGGREGEGADTSRKKWRDRLRWLKALGRQLIFLPRPSQPHPDDGTRFIYMVYEYRRGGYANLSSRPSLLTKFQ